jgi:hypothetical protein
MGRYVLIILGLIGLYLLLSRAWEANAILSTLADTSLKGIAVLQGKDVKGVVG